MSSRSWIILFLGWTGIHKFMDGKILLGFIYIATFGLFGFGWLFDFLLSLGGSNSNSEPINIKPVDNVTIKSSHNNIISNIDVDPQLYKHICSFNNEEISDKRIALAFMSTHADWDFDSVMKDVRYVRFYQNIQNQLKSMKSCDVSSYQIAVAFDDKLCPYCKKQSGKIYPVSSAQIGYNCPPFHKGCRCVILDILD